MVLLYIETNFLIGVAKGQEPKAATLLQKVPSSVQLVIPSLCYAEALTTLEKEKQYRKQFQIELNKQISEAKRDITSFHTKSLVFSLERSRLESDRRINDIQSRLTEIVKQLIQKAATIALSTELIQELVEEIVTDTALIEKDTMDNLILHCILDHASSHSDINPKVFLSNNTKDFGKPEVQQALREAGVSQYFTRTESFLGWLQS